MRKPVLALGLIIVLAVAMSSAIAWSRARPAPGCPRAPAADGSPCKKKHATCRWPCEAEGHRNLGCTCEKDDQGAWRWQCIAGSICVL